MNWRSIFLVMVLGVGAWTAAEAAEGKVTVQVTNAPLAEVLQSLQEQTGVEIVLAEPIEERLTLNLTDVPLETALKLICQAAGCTYRKEDGRYLVTAQERPAPMAAPPSPAPEEGRALVHHGFEGEVEGWLAMGGEVKVTTEKVRVHTGTGALEYRYTLAPETFNFLLRPQPGDLTGARSLRFWLKTSHDAALLVIITEADKSRYNAVLFSRANTWQHINLSLDRFLLADESTDENNRLDLALIGNLALMDVTSLLAQMAQKSLPPEERHLWLDEFEVSTGEAPTSYTVRPGEQGPELVWDNFEGGFLPWITLAGQVELSPDTPLGEGHSFHWKYEVQPNQLTGLIALFPRTPAAAQARGISLWAKTSTDTTLLIGLEEGQAGPQGKPSYHTLLPLRAADGWQKYILPFAAFQPDEDKPDPNGRLDLNQVNIAFFVDARLLQGQTGSGEMWFDEVRLIVE
ncbi:MAG TPA: hypothetical protein EYP85_15580 [Armatimonadetes bacterium]|nr:hypothetical protein [Armatimonadota bacterium]